MLTQRKPQERVKVTVSREKVINGKPEGQQTHSLHPQGRRKQRKSSLAQCVGQNLVKPVINLAVIPWSNLVKPVVNLAAKPWSTAGRWRIWSWSN